MHIWYNNILDNSRHVLEVRNNRVRIGRGSDNDIVLNSPFIAPEAAVLHLHGGRWELVALGLNTIEVGGQQLRNGERRPMNNGEVIRLWPFSLTLDLPRQEGPSAEAIRLARDQEMMELIKVLHLELLGRMDLQGTASSSRTESDDYLLILERHLEEIAAAQKLLEPARSILLDHIAGSSLRRECLEALTARSGSAGVWQPAGHWSRLVSAVPEREQELQQTIARFGEALALNQVTDLSEQVRRVERGFWEQWAKGAAKLYVPFKQYLALRFLKKEIKDIVFGYGPLEGLLRIPTVTEIMVVDRDHIFIEKDGVVENSGRRFVSDEMALTVIERIVSRVGRRIDKSSPLVDARLTDGSRVNAVIPPLAVNGPCLTVRKFPARKLTIDDLIARGSLTPTVAQFLQAAVLARCNILVSGGTGSGKTTLLNCLSDFIPDKERIVTVEDTAELQLHKVHVVRLESKAANVEGAGAYKIGDLVRNALRMRPDRIVVGECRGPEALDMLQAMNSGHDGSLTTLHANNAEDVILRLEVLVQMAADLPVASIHRQIASAVDLVVQLARLGDGSRRVTQITEIVGVDEEQGGIRTKDLFVLEGSGASATLAATGFLPTFMGELIEAGLLRLETFYR